MPDPINALPPTHADLQANAYNDALSHVVGGAPLAPSIDAEQACIDTLVRVFGWRDVSPDAHPRTILLKPENAR